MVQTSTSTRYVFHLTPWHSVSHRSPVHVVSFTRCDTSLHRYPSSQLLTTWFIRLPRDIVFIFSSRRIPRPLILISSSLFVSPLLASSSKHCLCVLVIFLAFLIRYARGPHGCALVPTSLLHSFNASPLLGPLPIYVCPILYRYSVLVFVLFSL